MNIYMDCAGTCLSLTSDKKVRPHLAHFVKTVTDKGGKVIFWTSGNIGSQKELIEKVVSPATFIQKSDEELPLEPHIIVDDNPLDPPRNVYSLLIGISHYISYQDAITGDQELLELAESIKKMLKNKLTNKPTNEQDLQPNKEQTAFLNKRTNQQSFSVAHL